MSARCVTLRGALMYTAKFYLYMSLQRAINVINASLMDANYNEGLQTYSNVIYIPDTSIFLLYSANKKYCLYKIGLGLTHWDLNDAVQFCSYLKLVS
jgi:hypothetical protein